MLFNELPNILNIDHSKLEVVSNISINGFAIYISDIKINSIYFHWKVGKDNLYLVELAVSKGAFVITSEIIYKDTCYPKVLYVPSIRNSMKEIALYQRNKFKGELIAITGSVGKSSVKNMLAGVLSKLDNTLYTLGNENSYLGIYCTLCNITEKTVYIVLETGASGPNSLSIPIQVVRPTIAILLEISWSHQEKYENFNELLNEKASIISALDSFGTLIISECTYKKLQKNKFNFNSNLKIQTVGNQTSNHVNFNIDNIELKQSNTVVHVLSDIKEKIRLFQTNYANGINVVYCWAVLKHLGISLIQFNSLIAFYKPLPRRFERIRICNEKKQVYELIDDAYNASPNSTKSLIESLHIRKARRKILILGDMLELGDESLELHKEILKLPQINDFNKILLTGNFYGQCDLPPNATFFNNLQGLIKFLEFNIVQGDLIILKASKGMKFYDLRLMLEKKAINISTSISWFIEHEYPNL